MIVKSLKICYVHEESSLGGGACAGIARYFEGLAFEMAKRGHRVSLLARNAKGYNFSFPGGGRLRELAPIYHRGRRLIASRIVPKNAREIVGILSYAVSVWRRLRWLEATEGLDIVNFVDWRAEGFWLCFNHIKAKTVVTLEAPTIMVAYANNWALGMKLRSINVLEKHMCERAHQLVSPSQAMAAFARERMPLRTAKPIAVVSNPVDTDRFRPMPEVNKEPLTVLFVGRIEPFKGSDIAAEAMRLVWKKLPEARLYFAGGANTWNHAWAQDFKAKWENEPRVTFLGLVNRDELPHLYNRATVLTVPSRYESFGHVCAEGMSCGLPVIASDAGSLPELIEHGRDGLLFPVYHAERLAQHLIDLLQNEEYRRRLGLRARQKVVDKFASPIIAAKMESIYQTLVGLRT